ncbi:MAG: rhomboid family intramembrane serine protease [archaeon]
MHDIRSETKLMWELLKGVIGAPFILILMLFKKKSFSDLFAPFGVVFRFLAEPKFTFTIVLLNILAFIASLFISKETFMSLALHPQDIISFNPLPLVTSGFLHAGIGHLLANMLGIIIFGRIVEREVGALKTGFIYIGALLISGIFSSLIHLLILKDNTPGVGASGALMGLVAAAMLLDPFYFTYELVIPLPIMVVGWLTILADILGILNPLEDGIGHIAHLGGFLSIAVIGFLVGLEDRKKLWQGFLINMVSLVAILAIYFLVLNGVWFEPYKAQALAAIS